MSKRFWLLVGSIYGLLLVGMATLQGVDILLAIPLLVYLGAAILSAPGKVNLVAERRIEKGIVEQNAPVLVTVTLTNQDGFADEIFIEDVIPSDTKLLSGQPRQLLLLEQPVQDSSPQTIELNYALSFRRGEKAFTKTNIVINEHFGLIQQRLQLPTPGQVQIMPSSAPLRKVTIHPEQTRGFTGAIPARLKGAGMSFLGVREYQVGDSLRRINWKIAARKMQWQEAPIQPVRGAHLTQTPGRQPRSLAAPQLFTNQFEQERIADVGLILDARDQTNVTTPQIELFDYSIQATAALAEAFLAEGHRVSLLIYGFGMQRVFPGYGKIQRELILRALAKAEPGSNYALESLNNLPIRLFPALSQLVMISPLGARDHPAYVRMRKKGYEVLLVSPNPVEFEAGLSEPLTPPAITTQTKHVDPALHLARLERNLALRRLTRIGVQVVDWPVDLPLEQTMHTALGRQVVFRRNIKMVIT